MFGSRHHEMTHITYTMPLVTHYTSIVMTDDPRMRPPLVGRHPGPIVSMNWRA